MDKRQYIEYIVDDLGAPKHLKGYEQLLDCIDYALNDDGLHMIPMYTHVANIHNVTKNSVERNIRHLIEWIKRYGDEERIYHYFGASLPNNGSLTNSQFIATLSVAVKRIMRTEVNNVNYNR